MERISVSSTNVASIGYDPDSEILEVEFLNGGVYQYSGVPAAIYEELMNASSKGTYINQVIKKSYFVARA
jgi:hypothetical protein